MVALGGSYLSTAAEYAHTALPAGTAAATGRRDEDFLSRQDIQKLTACRCVDCQRGVVVDRNRDFALRDELTPRQHDHDAEREDDRGKDTGRDENFLDHSRIPENPMKAIAMRPAVMKVMPRPFSPSGTSEYFSRSRIAASVTSASAQPRPEPKP